MWGRFWRGSREQVMREEDVDLELEAPRFTTTSRIPVPIHKNTSKSVMRLVMRLWGSHHREKKRVHEKEMAT